MFENIKKVCIHNGAFHFDETLSLVLCFMLGLREDVKIVRTRDRQNQRFQGMGI